ncbi:hypothetical protein J7I97_07380 [Streptomyces sp. ISL-87]|nr:hypothetical protein [Streptomyces sp. ISL-87]
MDQALAGRDARTAVAVARNHFTAYAAAVPQPVAVALRRPFIRLLNDLDTPKPPA